MEIVNEGSEAKNLSISNLMQKEPVTQEFLQSKARNSKSTAKTYAAGLLYFSKFLQYKKEHTMADILKLLQKNEIDVYKLLNQFVSYMLEAKHSQTNLSIALHSVYGYMTAVRSFFEFNDIEINPRKFKARVTMPEMYEEDEEALDASEIRKILLSCNNRRMKSYLLVLASGGLRAVEACALRVCDIDYTSSPTKIHVRKEYCKTRKARDVYISDEATLFLKQWLEWKYRERKAKYRYKQRITKYEPQETDLVFTSRRINPDPRNMYPKVLVEFEKILQATGFNKRKEGLLRRTITLHSFRRYVKTVISNQVSQDYSEWFLGHKKSPYYTMKEPMRREIYKEKCMKYLTYLDYSALESMGASIESNLEQKNKEIQTLKQQMAELKENIKQIRESVNANFDALTSKQFKQLKGMNMKYPVILELDEEVIKKMKLDGGINEAARKALEAHVKNKSKRGL